MKHESFEKTAIAHVDTLVERDALVELLQHPLLAELPRVEGYPVLGSYVLFAQLGKGGMANVFRGLHIRLENEVAIKVRTAPRGSAGARFQREATVAAQLEHPNIVRATDVDEVAGLQYMVLDYVDGEDADERVSRKGPLETREALTIIRDAALGLGEAHRLDFIHRDIKPANLMISREGRVKVADLGLAKSVVDDDLGLTAPGGILGTPMYMAPEQFRRAEEVCKASDVYGLGASACYLLLGRHPFDGKSVPEIMQQVCVQGIERLDVALPDLDPRVADVIAESVALDAAARPANGAELAVSLSAVLDQLGGPIALDDRAAGASKARGVNAPTREARSRIKAAVTQSGGQEIAATLDQTAAVDSKGTSGSGGKLGWLLAGAVAVAAGGFGWLELQKRGVGPGGGPAIGPAMDSAAAVDQPLTSTVAGEGSPNTVMSSAAAVDQPLSFNVFPIKQVAMKARAEKDWSGGYADLLQHAKTAVADGHGDDIAPIVESVSKDFRDDRRYKQTSELLDADGQVALIALAQLEGLYLPWTALMAAELSVSFNGITYEVDPARRGTTDKLLNRAVVSGEGEALARGKLLQGVVLLKDYMAGGDLRTEAKGREAQDLLSKAAELDPDGEAAGWLAVLYLYTLDVAGSEAAVPMWVNQGAMGERLEAALNGETPSGDAHYAMGHLCSDALAGMPQSMENAVKHYVQGARRGHLGCVSEAILYGGVLTGLLSEDRHKKLLHFAESDTPAVAFQVRDAYALAALTDAFQGDDDVREERRRRGLDYLRRNVEQTLQRKLVGDRDYDRLTIYLATITSPSKVLSDTERDRARAWIVGQKGNICDKILPSEMPPRSLPVWAHLLAFDPALAAEVADARTDPEAERMGVQTAQFIAAEFIPKMSVEDYADSPFIWSLAHAAQTALARH